MYITLIRDDGIQTDPVAWTVTLDSLQVHIGRP